MGFGRPHRRLEPETCEIARHELGRGFALLLVGRIGRDRLNLQELEQARQARLELGVDLGEDGGKGLRRAHGMDL